MAIRLKRMTSRRRLVAGSFGTLVAAAAVAVPASTSGQIYPGTTVHGVDVSGLSPATGKALLRATFAPVERHAVTWSFNGRTWDASLAEIGMEIDYDAMISQAMARGRDGSVFDRYAELLAGGARDVPLVLRRDPSVLRSRLAAIGGEIGISPTDAHLVAGDTGIEIVPDVTGRELDVERAMADTKREVCDARTAAVTLTTRPVAADVGATDLAAARDAGERLVGAPVYFTHDGETYPVEPDDLAGALVIDGGASVSLDMTRLGARLDAIATAVAMPPRNVMLGWNDGLYVVADDVDGHIVDRPAMEEALARLAASDDRAAELPMQPVRAEARTDTMHELGLDGHLAYGSSSFAGSSESRRANVQVSAQNISYKLVAPGERFSFNALLGPITTDNGFVAGTIIQGNWQASDIGGGVCQVSTTVFRAAARAGFRFDEWHAHSWRLAFYEADGSPPGFDGAIYQPNTPEEAEMDLAFTNPLDSWLLLMMVVEGDTVSAHFYGRDPGWTVSFGEAKVSEPKPIPAPVERVNPALAPGERQMVQSPQAGVTVHLRRTVTASDGTVVADGDFVSDYRSIPEAWEVGPGQD